MVLIERIKIGLVFIFFGLISFTTYFLLNEFVEEKVSYNNKESSNSNGYIQSSTNSSNYSNSSSDYSYSNSSTITLSDIKRNMSNTNKEIVGSVRLPNGDVGLTYIDGNRGGVYTSIISTDSNGNSVIVNTYRENY